MKFIFTQKQVDDVSDFLQTYLQKNNLEFITPNIACELLDKIGILSNKLKPQPAFNFRQMLRDGRDNKIKLVTGAFHFILTTDSTKLTWKVYDFIKDCPVDIEASFINNTFKVTDLNNDGVAEVWLMYKTVCHGDVSPCDMKIIMYQGQQKFAIRGQNKVQVSDKEFYGGDYKFDKAFADGPKEFLEFAKNLWTKNIMQKWGE